MTAALLMAGLALGLLAGLLLLVLGQDVGWLLYRDVWMVLGINLADAGHKQK